MTDLHLVTLDRWQPSLPGCYRTGVKYRFVCIQDHPNDPGKWCSGCVREEGIAPSRTSVRGRLGAENRSGTGVAANDPAPGQQPAERR